LTRVPGEQPGQLVQMGHISVSFPGARVKNFTAVCPTTGHLAARGIALYVLPPKSPQYNACVERAHRALDAFQRNGRNGRPHAGKRQNMRTQWHIICPSKRPLDVKCIEPVNFCLSK